MIRLNLMDAADVANAPAKPARAVKAAKPEKPAKVVAAKPVVAKASPAVRAPSRRSPVVPFLLVLILLLAGSAAWLVFQGVPPLLQGKIPAPVLALLGVEDSGAPFVDAPPPLPAEPEPPPQVVAQGVPAARPAVPANGAVEEIVKTLRPELFIKPTRSDYVELLPTEKVRYQKQAFAQILGSLYALTPENMGFLDLAYKAPDYYFVRGLAADPKSQESFLFKLKSASRDYKLVPATGAAAASPEFTAYGTMSLRAGASQEVLQLVPVAELSKEILALRDLALGVSVKFIGLENPSTAAYGGYKRTLLKTTTRADFPSLLQFAEALKNSKLRVGVLQFASRPTLDGSMASSVDFVIYSAP